MRENSEEDLLKLIKYIPTFFILIVSVLGIIISLSQDNALFEREVKEIKKRFISSNKQRIEDEVSRVYTYIEKEQENTEKELKNNLKSRVYEAYNIAQNIYNKYPNKSKYEVSKIIKETLRNIRFNDGRGYFYIYTMDHESVLHPIYPKMEGKSFKYFKESSGRFLAQEIAQQMLKEKEGFAAWYFPKPDNKEQVHKKIGFNMYFEPLDWYIGTGEYLEDFENKVKLRVLERINNIRYNKEGYVFVSDFKGVLLAHPNEQYVNANLYAVFNNDGVSLGEKIISTAVKKEGFSSYVSPVKGIIKKNAEKITFSKAFYKWNWVISSGFYLDNVNAIIKEQEIIVSNAKQKYILKSLLVSFVVMVLLVLITMYISHLLRQKFLSYKEQLAQESDKNRLQDKIMAQQSKMASMGEMIESIAHQWKQPLSIISVTASGMKVQKEINEDSTQEELDNLATITNNSLYLSHTIDDFRNFFKQDKNQYHFCLKDAVQKVLDLSKSRLKNKDVKILLNVKKNQIKTYENELIQVLMNILNNSIDAFEKSNKQRYIFIQSSVNKERIRLCIKDSAGGIDEEILTQIFDPYVTTKDQTNGTGIGLYMSQRIICEHMKGRIKATNTSFVYKDSHLKGALFLIEIPVKVG